jgi:probable O-glycosylation ligase (exosortase A-associated)
MHDLALVGFLAALFALGFRRPFLFVLVYIYVDVVSPQRLSYFLLNAVPISLMAFGAAFGGWLLADDKHGTRIAPRQGLILLLLIYCFFTTINADFPVEALDKWAWVWKALLFAIFLPLTLRTRARIEAVGLFMCLSAASIIIVGGIKTLASGGGYGVLNLMVSNNSGLYESSIISTVAITIIPLILYLMDYGTVFPKDWRVKLFCYALCFACMLIPVGTEARTGLVCLAVVAVLMWLRAKRKFLWASLACVAALAAIPFLPKSFTQRMDTIQGYKGDESASTRVAVWQWTIDYAKLHPFGGGFDAYRQNSVRYETMGVDDVTGKPKRVTIVDKARAYHSSYFEMLGEQGYPGLFLWIILHMIGILRMEVLARRYAKRAAEDGQWIGKLAIALQQGHITYLVGAAFVGIAFQPFVYMLVGMQIGLDTYAGRRATQSKWRSMLPANAATA